jgi:hypothetical protein
MNALDKVRGLLRAREQQVKQAVNKVGGLVDDKTKGKYHDTIEKVEQKAAELVEKAAGTAPGPTAAGAEPGATATPQDAKPATTAAGEATAAPVTEPMPATEPAAATEPMPATGPAAATAPAAATGPAAGEAGEVTAEEEEPVLPTAGTEPSTKADIAEGAAPAGVINADVAAADAAPTAAGTGTADEEGTGAGAGRPEESERAGEPGQARTEGPGSGS